MDAFPLSPASSIFLPTQRAVLPLGPVPAALMAGWAAPWLVCAQVDIRKLDAPYFDATWDAHQTRLRVEAQKALVFDPVLAQATTPMPLMRDEGTFRRCMAGECAIGNMFGDALTWYYGADFCVLNSGGFRGPGWPAGPIRVSDLWASLPFANTACVGTALGLKVWEMLNHSTALATFTDQRTPTGNQLLQLSGLRMTYNARLRGGARLLGVEVLDRAAGAWRPLERLRLYTFAVESFLCTGFEPYKTMLKAKYEGEVWTLCPPAPRLRSPPPLHPVPLPLLPPSLTCIPAPTHAFTPAPFLKPTPPPPHTRTCSQNQNTHTHSRISLSRIRTRSPSSPFPDGCCHFPAMFLKTEGGREHYTGGSSK